MTWQQQEAVQMGVIWLRLLEAIGLPDYSIQFRLENFLDGGWIAEVEIHDHDWLNEQHLPVKRDAREHGSTAAEAIEKMLEAACGAG